MAKANIIVSALLLAMLMLNGCAGQALAAPANGPMPMETAPASTDRTPPDGARAIKTSDCPVTPPSGERPPDKHIASWSSGKWYRSPDGAIWVAENNLARLPAADSTKVLWGKPAGAQLEVSGRRLDGEAPPLDADVSPYYANRNLNPSAIGFPTAGCWEIVARAGQSTLRIVVEAYPRFYAPEMGRCETLAAVVKRSDAIVVGEVVGAWPDRPGFAWQTVRVIRIWAQPQAEKPLTVNRYVEVLQHLDYELPVLQVDHTYLLFLHSRPGFPWRITCSYRTLAEVIGTQVARPYPETEPLWSSDALETIRAEVKAVWTSP